MEGPKDEPWATSIGLLVGCFLLGKMEPETGLAGALRSLSAMGYWVGLA